jgi:superoxide reductase
LGLGALKDSPRSAYGFPGAEGTGNPIRPLPPGRPEANKMAEVGQIYHCEICGNKVKVLEGGKGTLVCCGEDMVLVDG